MSTEHLAYYHFASKSRLDKAVNSLLGITEGIAIDSKINHKEIAFLKEWIHEYEEYRKCHPFNELLPVVEEALGDGILTRMASASSAISMPAKSACSRATHWTGHQIFRPSWR